MVKTLAAGFKPPVHYSVRVIVRVVGVSWACIGENIIVQETSGSITFGITIYSGGDKEEVHCEDVVGGGVIFELK
jgi:hypothetical protein